MVPFPMTLSDHNLDFKVTMFFNVETAIELAYIYNGRLTGICVAYDLSNSAILNDHVGPIQITRVRHYSM